MAANASQRKRNTPTKRRTTAYSRRRKPTTTTTTTTTTTLPALLSGVYSAVSAAERFLRTNDIHTLPSHTLQLHSTLSSLSSSLSFFQSKSLFQPNTTPLSSSSSSSSSCWFERFVLSSISDDDPRWVHIFRMSKPTFSSLSSSLSHRLTEALPSIPPHFALACALYKLAHDVSFSFLANTFGFTSSHAACKAFYAVCKAVCVELGRYVTVSHFNSDLDHVFTAFDGIQLRNCCGVLGFELFGVEAGDLLGKDGVLVVQALVDSQGRFLDVSAGWPSTFLPASVLRQTSLYLGVEESKDLLNGPEVDLFDGNSVPQYVLGDSWYPCLPWLLTPFVSKGVGNSAGEGEGEGLTSSEMEFNEVHRRAMEHFKLAFGRVRANWKLLNRRWKEEFAEFLPFIITTACVLNNFLMKHGETLPDVEVENGEKVEAMPPCDGEVSESAAKIRNLLALHLSRVSQR